MADALCGPSNPLQNFQKHSTVDRTLQQDRLVSHQGSSQNFRSGPGATAGILDPEFEAFQAGQLASPPPPQFENHALQNRFLPSPQQSHFQQPSALPDWANDFQRLQLAPTNIRPGSSHQTSLNARQAPVQQSSTASWHQDFMQSQPATQFQQQPIYQPYTNHQWQYQDHMQQPFSSISQGKQKESAEMDVVFDEAKFEAAFDAARQDALAAEDDTVAKEIQAEREEIEHLVSSKEAEETANRQAHGTTNHLTAMDLSSTLSAEEQAILEPDTAQWPDAMLTEGEILQSGPIQRGHVQQPEPESEETQQKSTDDEELSRTAGQLLDSVSHETSQKFQDSVFLNLMRRLRDKEVRVEGENFVEATNGEIASSTTISQTIEAMENQNRIIPDHENDLDNGRFTEPDGEPDAFAAMLPSRPLTPEIDPPGPPIAAWRQRLGVPAWPEDNIGFWA